MSREQWTAVDRYITDHLVPPDPALDAALQSSLAAGLPQIHVAPNQGKLLHLLARLQNARTILEIGTLAGYSSIWLARALPSDGRLITLEANPHHAGVARANIAAAGLSHLVDVRVGLAIDTLPTLAPDAPFDFIFIDADKANIPDYFNWAVKFSRRGSLIVVDNIVRKGEVLDAASADASVQGVRRFMELLSADRRVSATAIQTVGSKGYDGLAMALVIAEPAP